MVERKSGKIEVIVAGGSLPGSELSTEIFSVTDNRWRTGPKLPQAIVYGVSVPYRFADCRLAQDINLHQFPLLNPVGPSGNSAHEKQ